MARLPVVDGDEDNWGSILREFLLVEHDTDGTLKRLNQASGICPLDSNSLVPSANLGLKGAYSAIVYIDGSSVIARDYKGDLIASGTAGTDDRSVLQSAIDYAKTTASDPWWTYHYGIVKNLANLNVSSTVLLKDQVILEGGSITASGSMSYLVTTEHYEDFLTDPTYTNTTYMCGLRDIFLNGNDNVTDTVLGLAAGFSHFDKLYVSGGTCNPDTCSNSATGIVVKGASGNAPNPKRFFGVNYFGFVKVEGLKKGMICEAGDNIIDNLIVAWCSDVGLWIKKLITIKYAHVWGCTASLLSSCTDCKGYGVYITDDGGFKGRGKIESETNDYGLVLGSLSSSHKPIQAELLFYGNNTKDIYTEEDQHGLFFLISSRPAADIDIGLDSDWNEFIFQAFYGDGTQDINITGSGCRVQGTIVNCNSVKIGPRAQGSLRCRYVDDLTIVGGYNQLDIKTESETNVNLGESGNSISNSAIRLHGWLTSTESVTFVSDGGYNTVTIETQAASVDLTGRASTTRLKGWTSGTKFENEGSATIASGNTSVTVNHGLDSTPSNIQVTGAHSDVKDAYVTNVGATSFDINVGSAVSADRTVYWKAKV